MSRSSISGVDNVRRRWCQAMRLGQRSMYVDLDTIAELITVYTEREIERSLQGQPVPPIRARRQERTTHVRNHQPHD